MSSYSGVRNRDSIIPNYKTIPPCCTALSPSRTAFSREALSRYRDRIVDNLIVLQSVFRLFLSRFCRCYSGAARAHVVDIYSDGAGWMQTAMDTFQILSLDLFSLARISIFVLPISRHISYILCDIMITRIIMMILIMAIKEGSCKSK